MSRCSSTARSAVNRNCESSYLLLLFVLKGEGWYETDFKTDKKRNVVDDGSRPSTNGEAAPKDGDSKKEAAKTVFRIFIHRVEVEIFSR